MMIHERSDVTARTGVQTDGALLLSRLSDSDIFIQEEEA